MEIVDEVFTELRTKGLVKHAKSVNPTSQYPNFKMSRKVILYNPRLANLDRNVLRFILLHEEAHRQRKQNSHLVIDMIGFLFAVCMVIAAIQTFPDISAMGVAFVSISSAYLALFLMSMRIFQTPVQADEYRADHSAATAIKHEYGVRKPSEIVGKTLEAIKSGDLNESLPHRISLLLYGGMHPSDEDRIDRIKSRVDEP